MQFRNSKKYISLICNSFLENLKIELSKKNIPKGNFRGSPRKINKAINGLIPGGPQDFHENFLKKVFGGFPEQISVKLSSRNVTKNLQELLKIFGRTI